MSHYQLYESTSTSWKIQLVFCLLSALWCNVRLCAWLWSTFFGTQLRRNNSFHSLYFMSFFEARSPIQVDLNTTLTFERQQVSVRHCTASGVPDPTCSGRSTCLCVCVRHYVCLWYVCDSASILCDTVRVHVCEFVWEFVFVCVYLHM
jgi:hypothetical protein